MQLTRDKDCNKNKPQPCRQRNQFHIYKPATGAAELFGFETAVETLEAYVVKTGSCHLFNGKVRKWEDQGGN